MEKPQKTISAWRYEIFYGGTVQDLFDFCLKTAPGVPLRNISIDTDLKYGYYEEITVEFKLAWHETITLTDEQFEQAKLRYDLWKLGQTASKKSKQNKLEELQKIEKRLAKLRKKYEEKAGISVK